MSLKKMRIQCLLGTWQQCEMILRRQCEVITAQQCEMGTPQQCEMITSDQCEVLIRLQPKEVFAEETLQFLDLLSRSLRHHPESKKMPDLMSFAFWCRRAHLEQMKKEYVDPKEPRIGRGVSLHFASSNMPVLFAFSLTAGLLAGNVCIVRLPRKETRQEQVIIEVMKNVIQKSCPEFDGRIILCRYDHDAEINQMLSEICDVRVLWGTDASIAEIRKARLKPGATDICFGTRYSAAILDAKTVADTKEMDLLIKDFYNDTYLNDQNACSSPRILYWVGEKATVRRAQERFWVALHRLLQERNYEVPAYVAVQKLDAALIMAACYPDVKILRAGESIAEMPQEARTKHEALQEAGKQQETRTKAETSQEVRKQQKEERNLPVCTENNRIVRVQVPTLYADMWERTVPGGFFIEAQGETPDGLFPVLDRRCQTLTGYGIDRKQLTEQLAEAEVTGMDRLVDVGHALDFSLTWDRHNLIEEMSCPDTEV